VSITVNSKEIVGLVGESGSGKTTLARLLLRLLPLDRDQKVPRPEIWFDGEEITHLPRRQMRERRTKLRLMFQHPESVLNPFLRIRELLIESIEIHDGSSEKEQKILLESLLRSVNLSNVLEQYAGDLSGGQQRRVSILRTLIGNPKLIVADEPVASLDFSVQAQIIELIRQISEQRGIAFLLISHNLPMILSLSDRMMVMYRGNIVETGQKSDMQVSVCHPYTVDLWQSANYDLHRQSKSPLFGKRPAEGSCAYLPNCRLYELLTSSDQEQCEHEVPELRQISTNRRVACHHYQQSVKIN
jgi:ABC-type glutathione transport system ATPase component